MLLPRESAASAAGPQLSERGKAAPAKRGSASSSTSSAGTAGDGGKRPSLSVAFASGHLSGHGSPAPAAAHATLSNGGAAAELWRAAAAAAPAAASSSYTSSSLDWSNCCVFALLPRRGAVVQPPPPWPAACTATVHAVSLGRPVCSAPDFVARGPHFVDFMALHERGAASMAAVPVSASPGGPPLAVLSLSSSRPHAFLQAAPAACDTSSPSNSVGVCAEGADGHGAPGSAAPLSLVSEVALCGLASVLAPYTQLLEYSSRRAEMQRLVNQMITPVAQQLTRGEESAQLARLGCTVEQEAVAAAVAAKGSPRGGGGPGSPSSSHGGGDGGQGYGTSTSYGGGGDMQGRKSAAGLVRRNAGGGSGRAAANGGGLPALLAAASIHQQQNQMGVVVRSKHGGGSERRSGVGAADGASQPASTAAGGVSTSGSASADALRRAELSGPNGFADRRHHMASGSTASSIGASAAAAAAADGELDWGDFVFNMVSMCIVYTYFSRAAVAGESMLAIVLCMSVAAFDVALLLLRWLCYEQDAGGAAAAAAGSHRSLSSSFAAAAGDALLPVFQVYRLAVLPVANTWMVAGLFERIAYRPPLALWLLAPGALLLFLGLGAHARFFVQAPLQLTSVLVAAMSVPPVCVGLLESSTSDARCVVAVSCLQLTLGLLLPAALVFVADELRLGRSFVPHVQTKKKWLAAAAS